MKFDTRNKKPKLWNLLIQAVFVGIVLALMLLDNAHRHALLISGLTDRIFTNENAQTLFFFVMLGMACRGRDRRREANRSRLRRRSTPEPLPERGQRP